MRKVWPESSHTSELTILGIMRWLESELRCPVHNASNKRDGHVDQEASASCSGTRHAITMPALMRQLIIFLVPTAVQVYICPYRHVRSMQRERGPRRIPVIFNKQICVPESPLDYISRVV
ncbi:unnamed protein product [Fusarium venenatum]|uniref:Uncharacterized protein n=1 Tax=Fusarium venenatum TaxID=56646 RepID=A0A2L2STX0_9HYPO|nr:uncharacterized protein FVRRES_05238 [Fusarium venenatum]CEI60802.1 unnamed protein product [Fusarium venenatum]